MTLLWSAAESSGRQVLSLLFFFVTVRFLQPADLGRFSLAVAFSAVPQIFIDEMIGESLVQKAETTDLDWDTGFTLNLAIASFFLLVSFLVSWPLSSFMGEPFLLFAMPLLTVASLVGALGNIQRAFLARALRFRFLAQSTLVFQMVGGATSLCLAALGWGAWALIIGLLVTAAVSSATYWITSSWKPRLRVSWATARDRLSYAKYSAAIRAVYLLRDQSPLIIAGLLVNITDLGLFSLALRVVRSLGLLFEDGTTRPLLSLMSREQHDLGRFGPILTELMGTVALLAVPSYVGLAIVGPMAMPLVFGAGWTAASAFVPGLCAVLGGWLAAHIMVVSLRARSIGQVAFRFVLAAVLIDVTVLALLMPYGLTYAIIGWALRSVLSIPVVLRIMQSRLGVDPAGLAWRCLAAVAGAVPMAIVLEFSQRNDLLSTGLIGVCEAIAVGASVYLAVAVASLVAMFGKKAILGRLPAFLPVRQLPR